MSQTRQKNKTRKNKTRKNNKNNKSRRSRTSGGSNTSTCKRNYCSQWLKEKIPRFAKLKGIVIDKKLLLKYCAATYCNPSCKDTLFDLKTKDKVLKRLQKVMFRKKTNILKDDFYEGLSAKRVEDLKKNGALSGCTVINS